MQKRYGEKFCIANPRDKHSMEEAISIGYNVIYGSELSKDEWSSIKDKMNIQSTSSLFGTDAFDVGKKIKPNTNQKLTAQFAKEIAKRLLQINIDVAFVEASNTNILADYGGQRLRFNVGKLPKSFFDNPKSKDVVELIIHELAHELGGHIDYNYQEMCCHLGAELVNIALREPDFFDVK